MILTAEYVSNGHVDRLCDSIVNNIVNYVVLKDEDALCGLECAANTNKVFVDGVVKAGKTRKIINEEKIKDIVKETYFDARYKEHQKDGNLCRCPIHPSPEELEIILDVQIDRLCDEERALRKYSDDQNAVTGYALNSPKTDYLPIEQFVALKLGHWLCVGMWSTEGLDYGPDLKLLVQIEKDGQDYKWHRLSISAQHRHSSYDRMYRHLKSCVVDCLEINAGDWWPRSLSKIDNEKLYVNGAGDFIDGGPLGDNGLSGKKLCIDFYGPSIPIGGGAIYGKDPHKVDVCGALKARELAVKLVKEHNFYSVLTTLSWAPGEETPCVIEAYEIDEFGTKMRIDDSLLPPRESFSITAINNDLKLGERKIVSVHDIK